MRAEYELKDVDPEDVAKAMLAFSELGEKLSQLRSTMDMNIKLTKNQKSEKATEIAPWKKNRAAKKKKKRKSGGPR